MNRNLAEILAQRLLFAVSFSIAASCAVEVGNPHPDRDTGKKAHVDVSILSEQNFTYDQIGLNITGFGLISQQQPDNSVTFSVRNSFVLAKTDLKVARSVLDSNTTATGSFDIVRINFSRRGVGEIKSGTETFPIVLEEGKTFIDIPLKFQLTPGQKTNITLGFDSNNLLEEFRNTEGQVVSYTFKSEFGTDVASESLPDTAAEASAGEIKILANSYRLTVMEVNKDRQVEVRSVRLAVNNEWQVNEFKSTSGRIGPYTVAVQESSIDGSNYGWKALSGDTWKSANRTFDTDTGRATEAVGEYIQFDFVLPVGIDGIEFRGSSNEKCATLYQMDRLNAEGQWEPIPGSGSEMEACSLVNITW